MTSRIAIVAGLLLTAGIARASSSSVPAGEEKTLESGAPVTAAYLDYTNCKVNSKALTSALLQVPDEERGKVQAAGNCEVASNEAWPTTVDARDRR